MLRGDPSWREFPKVRFWGFGILRMTLFLKPCHIIGYAEDTLIVATARTVESARVHASLQTAAVIDRIQRFWLLVAAAKTEAILFHEGRKPQVFPVICIENKIIQVECTLKYLGIVLDSRLKFYDHFRYAATKAMKVARALGCLMPNLRDPAEIKRRLYASVVSSVLLYSAPVWNNALIPTTTSARRAQAPILRVQCFIALRVIAGYRTVSLEAASLLACIPPLYLTTMYYQRMYKRISVLKGSGEWTLESESEIRNKENSFWMDSDPYRTYFRDYLYRINKDRTSQCVHCDDGTDSAQHTLEDCASWSTERVELRRVIGADLSLLALIRAMLNSEEGWTAAIRFAESVMKQKDVAERLRQVNAVQ
ncbi:uncharacterized protein LOC116852286 [Odontomachus brunneus]|uniref:uncharacterized protein LOC116852286 n=1 Tax=Odontomachus brunneus TaxID=486640 RepID=UPI0013F1EDE8|nr:uncharacterized protein LOC116852286 [Odontomachus brunneus]